MAHANFKGLARLCASVVTDARAPALLRLPGTSGWSNLYRAWPVLHRMGACWPGMPGLDHRPGRGARALLCLGLCLAATAVTGISQSAEPTRAAGWLQLERDQRTYRQRVGPLDLREARELSTVERVQRNDLRAVEQRLERDASRRRRVLDPPAARPDQPGAVTPPPAMPRRGGGTDPGRALERQRLQLRMRQYRQPFGRMRPPR